MDELLVQIPGAIPGLDDLGHSPFALTITKVYHRRVEIARLCHDFLDPPALLVEEPVGKVTSAS